MKSGGVIQSNTIDVLDITIATIQEASHLTASTSHLIPPHGGELVQLIAQPERIAELKAHSKEWPSWDLTARQLCDLELLLSGGFSPLRGFMTRADYEGVCHKMRLADGTLWPMPVTLDVRLQGATDAQDHRVSIAFNGASLGEMDFASASNSSVVSPIAETTTTTS